MVSNAEYAFAVGHGGTGQATFSPVPQPRYLILAGGQDMPAVGADDDSRTTLCDIGGAARRRGKGYWSKHLFVAAPFDAVREVAGRIVPRRCAFAQQQNSAPVRGKRSRHDGAFAAQQGPRRPT